MHHDIHRIHKEFFDHPHMAILVKDKDPEKAAKVGIGVGPARVKDPFQISQMFDAMPNPVPAHIAAIKPEDGGLNPDVAGGKIKSTDDALSTGARNRMANYDVSATTYQPPISSSHKQAARLALG